MAEEALCLCSLARLRCGGSSVALLRSPGHRQHTTHTAHTAYSDNAEEEFNVSLIFEKLILDIYMGCLKKGDPVEENHPFF